MFCSRCGQEVQPSVKYCPNCGLDVSAITQGAGLGGTAAQPAQADDTAAVREALKDEYELEKELGRGGMAIVYKARDKSLEREVAIKVLPFSLSFDAEFVERFQREARTAAKLEHPNIIPIYRVGKSGRVIFFVMKFLRGKALSKVIEARGAIPVPEIKRVLIEAGRALGYAHKHGIVHRDIKPDNIMFDELGQAIVTDFGIAKAQSGARLTGTGMAIGTPHYMSPEQARAQNLDGRSDIYSLGVVAYQCLSGHVPFDGEDSFSIGYKHIMEELPTPAMETAEQRELFAVIQRMMTKKADERFQTAEDMVAALEGMGGVAAAMLSDVATRPTTAIGPRESKAAMASAPTTPLPRASASMMRAPSGAAAAPPGAAPAAPPAAPPAQPRASARPAVRPRPVPRPPQRSKAPAVVAVLLVLVIAALAGYYFGVLKPRQAALATTTADSARSAARRDSIARDSARRAARAESLALAARAESAAAARRPVRAAAGKPPPRVTRPPVATAVSARECAESPTISMNNPGSACWDSRPLPLSAPRVLVPPACTGQQGAVTVLAHVDATGNVVGNPTATTRGGCPQFKQAAAAYVADLRFTPAKKAGQPVIAWTQVLVQPTRQ